jgi:hypothetical protein
MRQSANDVAEGPSLASGHPRVACEVLEVTTGILIIHTPAQLEQASGLVDLLEASLSLPAGAILCSSLPGYAWPGRGAPSREQTARFAATLDAVGAAIALVDDDAARDPQVCFDLAAAWARGKRIAILADTVEQRSQLPTQLGQAQLVTRMDRAGIVSLVEDLAFDLGLNPRLGQDAKRALEQLSSAPPPPDKPAAASGNGAHAAPQRVESVPATPPIPVEAADDFAQQLFAAEPALEREDPSEEAIQLGDDDVEAVSEPEPVRENGILCQLSLEAGRAISEYSFHRDEGGSGASELDGTFGAFVDTVGGNWADLKRLGDVDVWLSATDNLLESLTQSHKHVPEWYELGFQFSTLQSIAEQGLPDDAEQRAVYQELWSQSMTALRESAQNAGLAARPIRRLQALLENLITPEPQRDYTNVARSLQELRALADEADRV